MSFLKNQIKEQKILEMEVDVDKFLKENNISDDSMIHTLVFDKSVFVEEKEVREYLKDKFYFDSEIFETDKDFIAKLVSSSQLDMDSAVDVQLRRGVLAMAADFVEPMVTREMQFNDKGDSIFCGSNLFADGKTINLTEGIAHIIEIARVAEGEHPQYGKLNITQEHLESMVLNFKSKVTGVDLAVNEDHKKNEAFGWFKDVFLSFDNQTLYGQVVWNPKGTSALSEKEYRYFSPEFRFNYTHPHTGTEHGATLLGGALTNYPFLKMEAITELNNKDKKQGVEIVENTKEATVDLSIHNAAIVELNGKIGEAQVKLDASEARNVELNDKVTSLETEIKKGKSGATHEKLFTEGKISAAQLVALNEGKGFLEVLALNEKLNTEGKGTSEAAGGTIELSAHEQKLADSLDLTPEEFKAQ